MNNTNKGIRELHYRLCVRFCGVHDRFRAAPLPNRDNRETASIAFTKNTLSIQNRGNNGIIAGSSTST